MKNVDRKWMGSGGFCICPKCEKKVKHNSGIPCHDTKCPECGARMLRKGSEHFYQWLNKLNEIKYKEKNNE